MRASLELQAATEQNLNLQYPRDYVFLDGHVIELPDGIDPSFLSALPDQLRREVVMEQFRNLGIDIRNRPIPAQAATAAAAAPQTTQASAQPAQAAASTIAQSADLNPEFLAALPPQIQEELLTRQRQEQQAQQQAAGTANPAAVGALPAEDDNAAFMRALPTSLRQAILFDMDHSQISALPEDLAAEARQLQQQHREREIDLFAAAHRTAGRLGGGGGARSTIRIGGGSGRSGGLDGIYNVASSILQDTYMYGGGGGGSRGDMSRIRRGLRQLNDADFIFSTNALNPSGGTSSATVANSAQLATMLERARNGRQLLDHESLACLLVMLFLDDPRMNMTKLHRVVRNLCIHGPTRTWVIRALLSILEKVTSKQPEQPTPPTISSHPSKITRQLSSKSPNNTQTLNYKQEQPSWLTMSIDGAFGSKTNVFTINKPQGGGQAATSTTTTPTSNSKKTNLSKQTPTSLQHQQQQQNDVSISVNQQACPAILKQILELLSTLARVAQFNFFPRHPFQPPQPTTPQTPKLHKQSSSAAAASSSTSNSQFWDIVARLDQTKSGSGTQLSLSPSPMPTTPKSSKSVMLNNNHPTNHHQPIPMTEFDSDTDFSVENSPLARLMLMLDSSVLRNNTNLMDKMLTCLAHASQGVLQIETLNKQKQLLNQDQAAGQAQSSGSSSSSTLENEPVLNKQIELVVNVLKNKQCSQDGLQQAYTLLNNLSKINSATRNMIIQHLLHGTQELGMAVCKEIEVLLDEAVRFNTQTQLAVGGVASITTDSDVSMDAQPSTSTSSNRLFDRNLIDSYSNLVISSPKTKQTRELQLPSMSILVEKNSNQKFFVRLIRLIINLREAIDKEIKKRKQQQQQQQQQTNTAAESTTSSTSTDTTTVQELARLSTELNLDTLWDKLSECLNVLKSLSDPYAVLILQQTVEAFFYVHAARKDKDETRKRERETREAQLAHLDADASPMSPGGAATTSKSASSTSLANQYDLMDRKLTPEEQQKKEVNSILSSISADTSPDTRKFLEFALTHRTVLNHILRQTSNNLSEEPYSVLVDFTRVHTHILDFDVKRRYFRQELDKLKDNIRGDDLAVHVRRSNVFDDSFRELNRRSPDEWKHRFYIVFEGEEGQDAGGLLREWYMIISKEIFNPDYALFMINPGDRVTYMPNPSSHCNSNHLSYFKFIGHIIAKAIFDNKFLDCYFTRAFYKHILGVPVRYTDMESVDNEFYKNLVSILESDIESFGIDLYFSIDINEFGVTQDRELKTNGRNIRVTNENKNEYVRLVCQEKMIGSIRQQVSAFLSGFYEIIPKSLISIFNEQELELLISGLPEIDLEDLKRNTEYHKYTPSSLQTQWFWRALKSFDKEDQAKFLQFVTGTSKVPLQGFAKLEGMNGPQKFQIHRDDRDTQRLPCAHTCFNQLDLPAYENYEKLRSMLLLAIRECSTGFGLA